jgi:hypothetical protein
LPFCLFFCPFIQQADGVIFEWIIYYFVPLL